MKIFIFCEKFIKKYFSLVEIALAIGILAVGAATVVTLFPVGMKQTRDSIGQNYSAIFADDAYAYFSSLAKQEQGWDTISSLPSYSEVFPITGAKVITTTTGLTEITGTDIFSTAFPGIYAIAKNTTSRPTGEQDYAAQVVVWQNSNSPSEDLGIETPVTPPSTGNMTTGSININPSACGYDFNLTTTDGTNFNEDSMKANKHNPSYYEPGQTFSASNLTFQTKPNDDVTINVGEESVNVAGKTVNLSSLQTDPLSVALWCESSGLGQWFFSILSGTASSFILDGIPQPLPPPGGGTGSEESDGVGVNVEISWPLSQIDYAKRNKLKYYFEIYNMDNIGL